MQTDHPETPKRRIRRVRGVGTPEIPKKSNDITSTNVRATSSRSRATMAPCDFVFPHAPKDFLPKRRINVTRMSMLPSQLQLDSSRIMEADDTDTELHLLYDEYLQSIMTEVNMRRRIEEKQSMILTELASIAKEKDQDYEKLIKLRRRKTDLEYLTVLQNEIDSHVAEADKRTQNKDLYNVHKILSTIYSLLKHLDVLRCENVIVPSTPEDWEETRQVIKKCLDTLESIVEIIGPQADAYRDVYMGLKEIIESHDRISDCIKELEKPLCNLQALVLKTASSSFTELEDAMDI